MRNEADTRAELIEPALKAAGWGGSEHSRIRREQLALGRLLGGGRRERPSWADFVLHVREHKLAVVEAKAESEPATLGLAQAKRDAHRLLAPFAFSTNGHDIYRVNMQTGEEGPVDAYPSPDELWDAAFGAEAAGTHQWLVRFGAVPFEDKGGQWQPRYYQHNAVMAALDRIAKGQDRILLTLATGTGKTAIAFQIAWKLFKARWNLGDWRDGIEPGAVPRRQQRILFLADRIILADQAFGAFGAFPDDAMVRIDPDEIRKKGRVPKNASVFFTIFQTFMTGRDEDDNPKPSFGDYPPDFFDLIIIDECHRGGANDESTWRAILDYFEPAVQIGLTATPKRDKNVDTYDYFGEPAYIYSLKEGINDGYLTPFRVREISTTLDEYVYTSDDDVVAGEIEQGKRYTESDFNRVIQIMEREKYRVELFLGSIDQREKTIVFCANQEHALAVRDLINQAKHSTHPDYCVRVTANEGKIGETHLRTFQDNEKTIPTILTTSQKLSTGVDARNVRHIVLMRPINSMIEFKQIIGRGTRLYEGKDYFTIHDFVKAHKHFSDPEWDGEPVEPETPDVPDGPGEPRVSDPRDSEDSPEPEPRPERITIKLADGKARRLQSMARTSFWSPDGKPISAVEFVERLFGVLPELFKTEAELRCVWSKPNTRRALLESLAEQGYGPEQLYEIGKLIDAEHSDLFDVLAYVAYTHAPKTREQRADEGRPLIFARYSGEQGAFLDFVLGQYVARGVAQLDSDRLPTLLELRYHGLGEALGALGGNVDGVRTMFSDFQQFLYQPPAG